MYSLMFFIAREIFLSTFSLSNGTEYTESFPSETKIDLVLKNHTTTEEKEVKNVLWAREKMGKFSDADSGFSSRDHLAHRIVALSSAERKIGGGEEKLVSFLRFSTFSTASHHRTFQACCKRAHGMLRMVGIIATNRSHKLKSFYGISTLPF